MEMLCRRALLVFRVHLQRLTAPTPADTLRRDIDAAMRDSRLYSMLKAFDDIVGTLWNGLTLEERQLFDRHFLAVWNSNDYPCRNRTRGNCCAVSRPAY
jgi:hypothetical protein